MAPSPRYLSFIFLIFLSFYGIQVQARESMFFSKFNHAQNITPTSHTTNNTSKGTDRVPQAEAPSPLQGEPSSKPQTHNGYGLYGHGSVQFPSTTVNENTVESSSNLPKNMQSEAYAGANHDQYKALNEGNYNNGYEKKQYDMSDMENVNTNYNNDNNNGYKTNQYDMSDVDNSNDNYNKNNDNGYQTKRYDMSDIENENKNNGYETKQFGRSDTRFFQNDNNNENYYNNNGYETKRFGQGDKQYGLSDSRFVENGNNNEHENYNNNNWYEPKQQGMSDTRSLENGKYFYNANEENYHGNKYQPVRINDDGFESSRGVDSMNKYNGDSYYGHSENAYEFGNSMGKSQYQEEDNQGSQQRFIP